MEGSLKATDTIIGKYDAQNLLKYKGITEVTNLLRSVSEHAVNINVERETFLRQLFVCNDDSNGTTLRKWFLFAWPLCVAPWTQGAAETVKVSTFQKLLFCHCFAYMPLV